MNLRGPFIAVACLMLLAFQFLATSGPASAQEPQFLGRTRMQWIDALESGQRRQRGHAAWAIQEFAIQQLASDNALLWLNELLLLTESHSSPSARYWGTFGLGRLIGKLEGNVPARVKALESLPRLLQDTSPAVRIAAADALRQSTDRAAALAVLVESLSHPQDAVRIQAAAALERWGEAARPAAARLEQATSDPSEYVKRIATRTLARLETNPSISPASAPPRPAGPPSR
ncbi:MAG: HEAT repeat domain-containing protein [Planctomycetaceae bacterium]|nr:HEAT repeat domain-containing protein [Planctomycetaceae bacterium]